MELDSVRNRDFSAEWSFSSSKSSGPGGQNVNKVNTRIELRINIHESNQFSDEEKHTIFEKLGNKINQAGELIIVAQENRSQHKNKEECISKFFDLLEKALKKPKIRKATKPTRSSVTKRLDDKKIQGKKKRLRKMDDI